MSPPSPALGTQQRTGKLISFGQECEGNEEPIGRSGGRRFRRMGWSAFVYGVREWCGEGISEKDVGNSESGQYGEKARISGREQDRVRGRWEQRPGVTRRGKVRG